MKESGDKIVDIEEDALATMFKTMDIGSQFCTVCFRGYDLV